MIRPTDGWLSFGLKEVWPSRGLLLELVLRDVLVRYKQTVFGVGWAVMQPLLTMLIFTMVFGYLAKVPTGPVPYPLFALAGILPWNYFSQAFGKCALSLVVNGNLVSKIYFPRLIIPLASVLSPLMDFAVSALLAVVVLVYYGMAPTWRVFALPVFTALALSVSLAFGLWMAALHVKYRDVGHIVPFVVQLGTYVSPVGYSSASVPERWRLLYYVNPMATVIDGFRWCVLAGPAVDPRGVALCLAVTASVLFGGLVYFRRTEEVLADVI